MHAEPMTVRDASLRSHARLLGQGGVTLAAVVLAYLALLARGMRAPQRG